MSPCKGLLILGFGGHARSVADVALAAGISQLLFIDDHARLGEKFLNFPVQKTFDGPLPKDWLCMPAAGDNLRRRDQIVHAQARQWSLATLIAPTSTIGIGATLAQGTFVAHHAHIGPMASVGVGTLVNTGGVVEHECKIGEYVHISVNTTVAGRSAIGDFSFIGAGAVVIDGITVCSHVTVGAGATVAHNIRESGVYVGTPARLFRTFE